MFDFINRYKKTLLTAVLFVLLCALCVAGLAWIALHFILKTGWLMIMLLYSCISVAAVWGVLKALQQ